MSSTKYMTCVSCEIDWPADRVVTNLGGGNDEDKVMCHACFGSDQVTEADNAYYAEQVRLKKINDIEVEIRLWQEIREDNIVLQHVAQRNIHKLDEFKKAGISVEERHIKSALSAWAAYVNLVSEAKSQIRCLNMRKEKLTTPPKVESPPGSA